MAKMIKADMILLTKFWILSKWNSFYFFSIFEVLSEGWCCKLMKNIHIDLDNSPPLYPLLISFEIEIVILSIRDNFIQMFLKFPYILKGSTI